MTNFLRNIDIYRFMDKNNDFGKMISNNVLYTKMWIFTKIWTVSFFQNDDLKKSRFQRYVDIFGNIGKKQFLKVISKERTFPLNAEIFVYI